MKKIIFEKKQLKLKETEELNFNSDTLDNKANQQKETNVDPSNNNGSPNLTTDINNAKSNDPTASTYDVNLSSYADKNKSTNPVIANFNVSDPVDAANTVQKAMHNNPQLANAVNNGNVIGKIHIANGNSNVSTTNESIVFSKQELDNFLKNL